MSAPTPYYDDPEAGPCGEPTRAGTFCQRPAVNGGPCAWHDPVRKPHRFWTPARLFKLAGLYERGFSDAEIGRHFGKSSNAVHLARKRHAIPCRSHNLLSARAVAREMGISCSKTVVQWIERKQLRGRPGQTWGPNRQWYVDREELTAFMDDPAHWHLWDPSRIPDRFLREHYAGLRTERYLTTGEVADRCYVSHHAVQVWVAKGILPAVRRGNWLIPESALVDFVPPGQRSKAGGTIRAWTAHEDATLLQLRALGWTWQRIAVSLNRSIGSVSSRWSRLNAGNREERAA